MEKTPLSLRTHVSLFGNTNAGKSALFNALLGQDMAIVSEKRGTTTDPVTKAMELLPYGPIALTDTAGLADESDIGEIRMKRTHKILNETDFALYVAACDDFDADAYGRAVSLFSERRIPHMLVFTKSDLGTSSLEEKYRQAVFVSTADTESIEELKKNLVKKLMKLNPPEQTMIGGLLEPGSTIVMVVPIDSEAPKGRLILPQVQFLRDCLDHGMKTIVVRDTELAEALEENKKIDLVVTDSQAFAFVNAVVPRQIKLTSFSMLMARMKGDINVFMRGAEAIEKLKDGSRILMAEACTHNSSHEDIGRVKIPALLEKYTGRKLKFDYCVHQDFPETPVGYDLVIHCGGCMINSAALLYRIALCRENAVPITNYGVAIAYMNGILERSGMIFKGK